MTTTKIWRKDDYCAVMKTSLKTKTLFQRKNLIRFAAFEKFKVTKCQQTVADSELLLHSPPKK